MMGHSVFPNIIDGGERWHEKKRGRFENEQFPQDEHLCSAITLRCWGKEYESAEQIAQDIKALERRADPVVPWKYLLFFPVAVIRWVFKIPGFVKGWICSILGLGKA
jgi:hypothetical protein